MPIIPPFFRRNKNWVENPHVLRLRETPDQLSSGSQSPGLQACAWELAHHLLVDLCDPSQNPRIFHGS